MGTPQEKEKRQSTHPIIHWKVYKVKHVYQQMTSSLQHGAEEITRWHLRADIYKGSFFLQTNRDWNALPESVISSAEVADVCVAKASISMGCEPGVCGYFGTSLRHVLATEISRRSPEHRLVQFTRNVVTKCLIYVAIGSQFSLIYLANMSCSKMIATKLRGSATSSRRVRDNRDDFATILRGILSHKILNIFATTLRHLATHARKLQITGDCFETALRPTRDVCRQLPQNSRSPVR